MRENLHFIHFVVREQCDEWCYTNVEPLTSLSVLSNFPHKHFFSNFVVYAPLFYNEPFYFCLNILLFFHFVLFYFVL